MAGSEGASLFSYGMLPPHDDGPASSEDGSGMHSPVLYPSAHGDSFRPYHDIPSQYDYQQGPPQPAYPPNPQSFLPRPQPHIIDFDPRPQPEWYPRQLPHHDHPYPRQAPLVLQPDNTEPPSPTSPQHNQSPSASREDRKPSSVVIACRQCRSRKIRCDSTRPVCNNCVRRNNPCEYDSVPKRRGPDKRPGTRQRSCKKRPADGSLPPPSKKKKTSAATANNNPPPASNNNSIGNNPGSDRLDVGEPQQLQLQPHHHHHRIKENGSPPPGIQQRHLDKQLPQHHSSQSYQYHHSSNVPIDLHTSPIMADQNRSSYPMGYGYDQGGYPKQTPSASSFRPSPDVGVNAGANQGSFQPIGSPMALHHPGHPAHQPARASYEVQKPAQLEMSHRARWDRLAHNPGVPAIVDEIKFLIDGTSHMLSFINIDNLAKRLWQEDARTSIHPAFIYAALGLARLMRSSSHEGGDQGLNIALSYRAEAVRCITESRDMRWIDLTLVEGALILAIFESSAQPSFTHANAARALVDLDELVRVMGLTANDAAMADVSRFSRGGVPIVLTPGASGGSPSAAGGVGVGVHGHGHGGGQPEKDDKEDVMGGAPGGHGGRRCNCLAVLALSPASSQASIAAEGGGGGGGGYPPSAGGVSPVGLSVSPALGGSAALGAMGRHVGASPSLSSSSMPPWDPAWSPEETRNEEVRRLCWSALDLVSSFLAQCAVDGRSVPDFFLGDVSKWVLYFPGEVVEQQRAAAGAHRQQQQQQQQLHSQLYDPSSNGNGAGASSTLSPKESIWALYCRSMLLWNYCFKFRDDTSSPLYSVRGEHSPREGHSSVSAGRAGERDAPPPASSGGYGREGGGYRDGPPPATSSSSSSGGAGEYHREGAGGGGGGYRGETHSPQYRGEFKHEESQFGRGGGYREHHQQFKHEEGVVGIPPGYGHSQQQGYGHPQHPHPQQHQQHQQPQHPHAQGGQGQGGLSREEEDDARAEEVWEAWTEVQAIEDSLDCHKCGLDSGIMYTTREYIHNVRMVVTQALRNLQGYDRGQGRSAPGPVVKRQQAEDWIYYQDLVVRRVGATITMLRSPDGVQLTQRPFRVQWFIRQLSVCLQLWNHDRTLHDALKLGKRLLHIVETMNHLWVCPSNARETAELRERLAHACVHVGLAEPLTSTYIGPAIIHP